MSYDGPETVSRIYIRTGNVLNTDDLTKKAGRNATEEVFECLNVCLPECPPPFSLDESTVHSMRNDHRGGDIEEERFPFGTNVKIILSTIKVDVLEDSIKNLFKELNEDIVDSVTLSLDRRHEDIFLPDLLTLWAVLERYVEKRKILRLGVSDINTDLFIALHETSTIKPTIVQINLNVCCVVPEGLQEFTKNNGILLLTHNDPKDILPQSRLAKVFGDQTEQKQYIPGLEWMLRYLTLLGLEGF